MLNLLSIVVFLPLFGAFGLAFFPAAELRQHRVVALIISLVTFGLSLGLWLGFDASPAAAEFQFEITAPWVPSLGISYHVGLDWEAMLIPMYLLIGIWGSENRIYATVKFFIYTFVASVLMLVAIIYVHAHDGGSFDYLAARDALQASGSAQRWLFLAFALAFAVKVPMFPLHTWLPDAHTEAPTAGSVILAGVLLKMGTFGFFRYAMPLFPEAALQYRVAIATLAVIGIVYGALMSLVQTDMKRLVAYSSVSHLGFVMLGLMAISPEGLTGGVYQMLNHGVSTGALFLLVGILYERRHTRLISEYGGLAKQVPALADR